MFYIIIEHQLKGNYFACFLIWKIYIVIAMNQTRAYINVYMSMSNIVNS